MTIPDFVSQLVSLSWLRCAIDEGVKFVNTKTGAVEKNEFILFQHFEHKTDQYVMPKVNVTPKGLESALFETIGRFFIENTNQDVQLMLQTPEFKHGVRESITKIREKGAQPLRGTAQIGHLD